MAHSISANNSLTISVKPRSLTRIPLFQGIEFTSRFQASLIALYNLKSRAIALSSSYGSLLVFSHKGLLLSIAFVLHALDALIQAQRQTTSIDVILSCSSTIGHLSDSMPLALGRSGLSVDLAYRLSLTSVGSRLYKHNLHWIGGLCLNISGRLSSNQGSSMTKISKSSLGSRLGRVVDISMSSAISILGLFSLYMKVYSS